MIDEHRKFIVKTVENENLEFEVNFSNDPKVNECKIIRIHKGKDTFTIKRDELTAVLMMIGDLKTQKQLLPTKFARVKKIERMLTFSFAAKKDYKQGEQITVQAPWIDEVPTEEEICSGNLNRRSKIYTPKL